MHTCRDCKFYLAVDVFKGLCKKTKDKITPDTKVPECFEKQPKCKFCSNFELSKNNNYLGRCCSKVDAYPDMIATTCELFKWSTNDKRN